MIEIDADDEGLAQDAKSGYDSNDPKKIRERKAAAGRKQQRLNKTLALIMSQPNGRELLWELLAMCGTHRTPFHENPHFMSFQAGEQNFGFKLTAMMVRADTRAYSQMITENTND